MPSKTSRYYTDPDYRQKVLANKREKYKQKPRTSDECWRLQLWTRYRLTPEKYNSQFANQKGKCAICGLPPEQGERLCVDHDHRTKRNRGLLHRTCNMALGLLKDDSSIIRSAASYLETCEQLFPFDDDPPWDDDLPDPHHPVI